MENTYSLPSQLINRINEFSQQHYTKMNDEMNGSINHCDICIELLFDICEQINYKWIKKSPRPEHRSIQYICFNENIMTFVSVFDRITKWFYQDAINLNRTILEWTFRIYFISLHKESYLNIRWNIDKDKEQFKFSKITQEIWLPIETIYDILSKHSHWNAISSMKLFKTIIENRQNNPITPELKYDKLQATMPFNYLYFNFWSYINFACNFFLEEWTEIYQKSIIILTGLEEIIRNIHEHKAESPFFWLINDIKNKVIPKLKEKELNTN